MSKISINPINDRIVTEILKGKAEINYTKQMTKDNEDTKNSYNKVIGNLNTMTLKKYITNIINYHSLGYSVSDANAFVYGCPVEWDLIIVKQNAVGANNVYKVEDVVALVEFKMSGLVDKQYKNIENTFYKQFKYIEDMHNKTKDRIIPFCYITFAETPKYFAKTKEYFDKMNGISNTAFAFIDYSKLKGSGRKNYFPECNDFEAYLYNILNVSEKH